jgi:hypothetical protein
MSLHKKGGFLLCDMEQNFIGLVHFGLDFQYQLQRKSILPRWNYSEQQLNLCKYVNMYVCFCQDCLYVLANFEVHSSSHPMGTRRYFPQRKAARVHLRVMPGVRMRRNLSTRPPLILLRGTVLSNRNSLSVCTCNIWKCWYFAVYVRLCSVWGRLYNPYILTRYTCASEKLPVRNGAEVTSLMTPLCECIWLLWTCCEHMRLKRGF